MKKNNRRFFSSFRTPVVTKKIKRKRVQMQRGFEGDSEMIRKDWENVGSCFQDAVNEMSSGK